MAADTQCAVGFILSGGAASDAAEGGLLLDTIGRIKNPEGDTPLFLLMDRAYEEWETRRLAFQRGYSPAVPPKKNRIHPWVYDKTLYKRRNEGGRMIRRLKGFRRIGTRYDKLDGMFSGFIYPALSLIALSSFLPSCLNTP